MRARARNRRERNVLQGSGCQAIGLKRPDRVDLLQPPAGRLDVEPGQKARYGRAVTLMRGPRASELRRVFRGLDPYDGIDADLSFAPALFVLLGHETGSGGGVECHAEVSP